MTCHVRRPHQGLALLLGLAALACASTGSQPPDPVPDRRDLVTDPHGHTLRTQDTPSDATVRVRRSASLTLSALSQVYADIGVPIGTMQSAQGVIGNARYRVPSRGLSGIRLSSVLDCGVDPHAGPRTDSYEVMLSVLSTVAPDGDSASYVTTVIEGQARPRGASNDAIHCSTTGSLENVIADRLKARLAGA